MASYLIGIHLIFGLLFVLFVVIQDKGSGLSAAMGGTGAIYASQRGVAKVVHYLTMVFATIFVLSALLYVQLAEISAPDKPLAEGEPLKVETTSP